jgi:hypothetical protein
MLTATLLYLVIGISEATPNSVMWLR